MSTGPVSSSSPNALRGTELWQKLRALAAAEPTLGHGGAPRTAHASGGALGPDEPDRAPAASSHRTPSHSPARGALGTGSAAADAATDSKQAMPSGRFGPLEPPPSSNGPRAMRPDELALWRERRRGGLC